MRHTAAMTAFLFCSVISSPATAAKLSGVDGKTKPPAASDPAQADMERTAALLEAKYQEEKTIESLVKAAAAYTNIGRDARAILYMEKAGREGDAGQKARAATSLREWKRRAAPVTIIGLPADLPMTSRLVLSGEGEPPQQVSLADLQESPGALPVLHVNPRLWSVTIIPDSPAYGEVTLPLSVGAVGPATLTVELPRVNYPVTFQLGPGAPPEAKLTLKDPTGSTPTREEIIRGGEHTLQLRPGTWQYSVKAEGYSTTSGSVVSMAEPTPVAISLVLEPPPPLPIVEKKGALSLTLRDRQGLGIGFGVAAITLTATGVGFAAMGARRGFECAEPDCLAALDAVGAVSIGTSLIGSGVGAAVGAVSTRFAKKRSVLKTEAIVGGALFVGGLAWYLAEVFGCYDLGARPRDHAAAMILGTGAGLAGASVTGLGVNRYRKRHPRSSRSAVDIGPNVSPRAFGVTLRAAF